MSGIFILLPICIEGPAVRIGTRRKSTTLQTVTVRNVWGFLVIEFSEFLRVFWLFLTGLRESFPTTVPMGETAMFGQIFFAKSTATLGPLLGKAITFRSKDVWQQCLPLPITPNLTLKVEVSLRLQEQTAVKRTLRKVTHIDYHSVPPKEIVNLYMPLLHLLNKAFNSVKQRCLQFPYTVTVLLIFCTCVGLRTLTAWTATWRMPVWPTWQHTTEVSFGRHSEISWLNWSTGLPRYFYLHILCLLHVLFQKCGALNMHQNPVSGACCIQLSGVFAL